MNDFTPAEQQIITSLAWFRSRYALFLNLDLNRKANQKNIEEFGKIWIGNFKLNWDSTFNSLIEKNILRFSNGEYHFTQKGELVKDKIESEIPFYKYEYDYYFALEKNSKSHSEFCKKVYGKDLSQHGLIDTKELSPLLNKLTNQQPKNIADIGCGNGKITEYIASKIKANFIGIDISKEAIQTANNRTKENTSLLFQEGNLNSLNLTKKYDAILFLDTLYYAEDLKKTIRDSLANLTENGRLFAYFSQWIMSVEDSENLKSNNTLLGKVLTELGVEFTSIDLTLSGIKHWKKKLKVLKEMKNSFLTEGNQNLWEYRYREANRYANWSDHKYARYLYEVKN